MSIYLRLQARKDPQIISGNTKEMVYDGSGLYRINPVYRTLLQRSLISVNVMGSGYDCARFWEILAARAMLFTQKLDIEIPYPFTDGVSYVTFASLEEFEDKLAYYLEHLDEVEKIARRGHEHLLLYHTSQKRAEYFLEVCKQIII
ncbi:MAG: glycosyltransferase [Candidatus Margulisbacteria bacterium]|nr:glycosyltransferase [Candidatus Margulisiibacteriota bacterium]